MLYLGQWVAARWLIVTHHDVALTCMRLALWLGTCPARGYCLCVRRQDVAYAVASSRGGMRQPWQIKVPSEHQRVITLSEATPIHGRITFTDQ